MEEKNFIEIINKALEKNNETIRKNFQEETKQIIDAALEENKGPFRNNILKFAQIYAKFV